MNNCCYHFPSASGPCHWGSWGLGPWSKAFQQLPPDISFLQLCGCISVQQIPADLQILTDFTALHYQISFLFSKEKSSMVVTFTKSVFPVLLLQAAAAETFLPLSSPPSPPLPQGNSMGSPFLWPHTATKHSSPRGEGACAITGSPHLWAQGKHRVLSCICIWIACFLNNVLRGTAFKLG